jgi:hypothetical protein
MDMDDSPIYLTADSAGRVARVVRTVERMPISKARGPSRQLAITPTMTFVVTTLITAATSQIKPGKGFATMCDFDLDTEELEPLTDAQFLGIRIYSLSQSATISVGSSIQCNWQYGCWWYCVTECLNGISNGLTSALGS